jgi:hypothetical protein
LRYRSVLEDGVLSTLDAQIDWEGQGFALADGWDGQNYTGLVLPTDSVASPPTVDSLLLVEPGRATKQREREPKPEPELVPEPGPPAPGPHPPAPPAPPSRPTRFFGTAKLDPNFYARDFGRITSEVIQHLAAVNGAEMEVQLEISAIAKDGFDEAKVRTVSENAQTLKFEQSGFEAD